MRAHFQTSILPIFISSMVIMAGCSGPAPTPQQPKAEQTQQHASDVNRPSDVDRSPGAVEEPVKPVERPRAVATAAPKPKPAAKESPRTASAPQPSDNGRANPATAPAQTANNGSTTPGTLTLPAPTAPPVAVPAPPPPDEIKPIAVEPPPPREVRIPSGTLVSIRMIDSVDSSTAHVGETFKASLDAPLVVENETVFPKGSEVYVKLTKVDSAGRVSGKSEVQLQLDRIFLGRKSYTLDSSTYVSTGAGQAGRTARSAGVGAAIGAAIGAIAGGGKGAAIGGATGAGAGAGVEAVRKGEQVRVDSETRLDFRLESPVEVTLQSPSSNTSQRNNPSGPTRLGTRQ